MLSFCNLRKNLEENALELKTLSNKQNRLAQEQRKNMDFLIINKLLNSKREKNIIKNNIFPKKNRITNNRTSSPEILNENLNETILQSHDNLLKNEENGPNIPFTEAISENTFNKSKIPANIPKKNAIKNSKQNVSTQNETATNPPRISENYKEKKTRFKEKTEKGENKPNNDLEKERNSKKILQTDDLMDFYSE